MNKKLKVGMYVRFKSYLYKQHKNYECSEIGQIVNIIKRNDKEKYYYISKDYGILQDEVFKASYDISDVIEIGDYVNGMKVLEIDAEKNLYCDSEYYCGSFDKDEIYSIVTKEQFELLKYEVN